MGKRKPEDDLESEEEEDDDDVVEVSGDEDEDDDDGDEDSESGDEDEGDEDDEDDEDEDDEGSGSEGDEEEETDGHADFDDGLSGSDFDDDLIQDDEFEGVSGSDISDGEAEGSDDANETEMGEGKVEQKGGIGGAFGRAFSSIMNKKVPKSELTDSLGPVLAERKQLLVKKLEEEENERRKKTDVKKKKREREKGHTIPQTYTDVKEKALIKLATTGVVRLFNAVSKAQKVQADADISSSKSAKATWKQSKQAFMTQLRGGPKDETRPVGGPEKSAEEEEEAGWSALKDDFMLGTAKMKDWDKNPEDVAV
ncbi:hypothetical protein Mapa_000162 [Marchantia paleacea]|nr:hypothetical protein Mapa_000162 [Marchantia paleacea]